MINRQRAKAEFQVAMMLLTRLPAGRLAAPIPELSTAVWAFPVVGLLVGTIGATGLALALWFGLAPTTAAGIAVMVSILATGGLHEDGLADLADGFGGGQTRARKLEIMRDSRIGSYGTLALILSVGLRWQSIAVLAAINPWAAVYGIIAVAMTTRAGLPAMMVGLPPARAAGLGHAASGGGWTGAAIAVAIGCVGSFVLLGPLAGGAVALAVGFAVLALGMLALRQIGGQTGDVLGAGQQISEVAAWLVLQTLLVP